MLSEWLAPCSRFLETEVLTSPSLFLFAAKGKEGRKALQQSAEEERTWLPRRLRLRIGVRTCTLTSPPACCQHLKTRSRIQVVKPKAWDPRPVGGAGRQLSGHPAQHTTCRMSKLGSESTNWFPRAPPFKISLSPSLGLKTPNHHSPTARPPPAHVPGVKQPPSSSSMLPREVTGMEIRRASRVPQNQTRSRVCQVHPSAARGHRGYRALR